MGTPPTLLIEPGQRFGRWVVLELTRTEPTEALPYGRRAARCRCDCGTKRVVQLLNLGHSQSCGCYRSEQTAANNRRLKPQQITQHGLCGHYLYQTWWTMLKRCEDPNFGPFGYYGARGISVCEEWHDIRRFIAYVEQVLGPRPDGYSLDRINNDGNYEPGNIRWATASEQIRNQRPRAPRTHCRRGHLFTPETTFQRPNGSRTCRTCLNTRRRELYSEAKHGQ